MACTPGVAGIDTPAAKCRLQVLAVPSAEKLRSFTVRPLPCRCLQEANAPASAGRYFTAWLAAQRFTVSGAGTLFYPAFLQSYRPSEPSLYPDIIVRRLLDINTLKR